MSLASKLEAMGKAIAAQQGPNPEREAWVQLLKDVVALVKKNAPDALSSEEQAALDADKAKAEAAKVAEKEKAK
jgi:hypothetical protein